MPEAGQVIRALDFVTLSSDEVVDNFNDFSTTGFEPTDPACELTFLAPTSGTVRFDMSIRIDADVNNERIQTDVEVRIDDDTGDVIHSPTVGDAQGIHVDFPIAGTSATNHPGFRFLEGLIPGRTYFAQLQHNTSNIDIFHQSLAVVGVP